MQEAAAHTRHKGCTAVRRRLHRRLAGTHLCACRSRVGARVRVPAVHAPLSSRRVLTMEFANGVSVTDAAALHREGLQPAAVAELIAQAFSEMIFLFGDVHCDPHAANMLVRRAPCGGPELVLLDHGLYRCAQGTPCICADVIWHPRGVRTFPERRSCNVARGLHMQNCYPPNWPPIGPVCVASAGALHSARRHAVQVRCYGWWRNCRPHPWSTGQRAQRSARRRIDDDFRHDYAALWHALIFADREGIRESAQRMNAGDQYAIFASMLTQKPWETIVQQDSDRLYRRSSEVRAASLCR